MCSIFFEFCLQRCFKFFASHELQEIEATATHLNQNSYYLSLPLNILTSARARTPISPEMRYAYGSLCMAF